ncbi:PREDICTED: lambda-crystallin-like [Priapulus caudatus]|uniref:Lambda-crystallin-like n=1 Tax=Priapulus caudatus TaxID=37621 RepID=A0ABM1F0Z2_PRICU|nr:PREDICTED: lambda-crystallin-like [Priapulus caudatus]
MLFAAVGHPVCVYDVEPKQILAALEFIEAELKRHEKEGTLRGTLNAAQQRALISSSSDLKSCVSGAIHVQECVPEDLELKKRLFEQLDAVAPPGCVLASSTSCLLPSTFSEKLKNRTHVIVAHPYLNVDGMVDYMRRHGAGLERVSATMGPTPAYTAPPPSLEQINKQLQEMTPLGEMGARRAWRDKMLSALARLKRDMETE